MSDDIKIAQEKAEEKKDRTGAEQDKNLDKLTDRVRLFLCIQIIQVLRFLPINNRLSFRWRTKEN